MPKGQERRYNDAVKDEVVGRVLAGEGRAAVARQTGIPLPTVSYWVRTRGGNASGGKAGKAAKTGKAGKTTNGKRAVEKARRGSGAAVRKVAGRPRPPGTGGETVSWAFEGDVLVVRIPLGRMARRIAALKVLATIKSELER
jgi:transposase-like protein